MNNSTEPFSASDSLHAKGMDCGGVFEDVARSYVKNYHSYFTIILCIFGTVSNILNIAVLTRKDMICAPINRILTALAVADMLIMIEYAPYACYYHIVLPEKMDFTYMGAIYILCHVHVTQVLHTISICLTLTLAIWRYLSIGYPERSYILCSDKRCTLAITLSFLLPAILCSPSYLTITITKQEIIEENQNYILYHTDLSDTFKNDKVLLKICFVIYAVLIKLLPCCILSVISCWLIRTLFKAKKRKRVLRSSDPASNDFHQELAQLNSNKMKALESRKFARSERQADRTTKMLIAVLFLFLITEFPQGIFALLIAVKGKDLFLECYQLYGEVMDVLALVNGAINFILYCCMSRMFRNNFRQLFGRRALARLVTTTTPSEVHITYV